MRGIWRSSALLRPRIFRAYAAATVHGNQGSDKDSMASQMVEYANSFRKKGDSGYMDAMQVLEHGVSFMKESGESASNALCKIQFTIANFHADQGKLEEAIEALQCVASNASAALELRVSALEAITGLYLQAHEDELAASQLDALSQLVGSSKDINARLRALSALVKLSQAQYDAAASCFEDFSSNTNQGAATLARAEVLHVKGNSTEANDYYESAINLAKEEEADKSRQGGATMTSEEVHAAALAGLGQLYTDLGKFPEAEKTLTDALHVVENISGESHARVGLVLSCMADLYAKRAKSENTGFMIPEGLFRRSLSLLKAPELDKEVEGTLCYIDAIALTRARYADILCSVQQRASEGNKMKSWASSAWKNKRSLSDVLTNDKLKAVLDVRFGRIF